MKAALSLLGMLLALGGCGERELASAPQGRPDTASMGASGSVSAAQASDAQIVAKLKAEYAADSDISAMVVDIDSKDGMVTLSGMVPNSDARVRADRIARAMKEVKSVNNQIEVRPA
ncbi:MAG: BON domain-containing protein [Burkholderiales bacterium]|nr:BON domain-containing protein [Burkholderiales bacterium]